MVEFGADTAADAAAQARRLMEALDRSAAPPSMRLFTDPRLARRIWDVRESSLGVTSHVPGEPLRWEGFEDSAVAPDKLGAYLRDLRRLMQAFHYDGSFYGHFGHACVHTRMDYDLESARGRAQVPPVHGRGCRPRGPLRRLALRRTWRRAGPRRTSSQDVWTGTDAGLPRVQIALGSRLEDEPGQAHRTLSARRKSAPRRGL